MSLRLVTPPADLAVSLDEAKAHLRVDSTDEDAVIAGCIAGAIGWIDGATGWLGRALGVQTWDMALDGFPGQGLASERREGDFRQPRHRDRRIVVPLPPLRSVESVSYLDDDGEAVPMDPTLYRVVDKGDQCSHIVPVPGACWPSVPCTEDAVTVRFEAGYVIVPPAVRSAILLLVGHLYENREAVNVGNVVTPMPLGVEALLSPFKVWPA